MRIIVCGSRDWADKRRIFDVLKSVAPEGKARNLQVVHGGCPRGADAITHALLKGNCDVFKADWDTYGKAAGHIRNRAMAEAGADLCVAFWDGKSRGTKNMIEEARRVGIPVLVINP
jgi:hypothetical protein